MLLIYLTKIEFSKTFKQVCFGKVSKLLRNFRYMTIKCVEFTISHLNTHLLTICIKNKILKRHYFRFGKHRPDVYLNSLLKVTKSKVAYCLN